MKTHEVIKVANNVAFQRLLEREFRPGDRRTVRTLAGASVTIGPSRHRSGIPPDATCLRYLIEHPDEGWTFAGRAVWRQGKLFEARATHCVIERFWDDAEAYGGDDAVAEVVNQWLRSA